MPVMNETLAAAVKEKSRRGYRTLRAVDPRDGKPWEVLLSDRRMAEISKRGMGATQELAFNVPEVILRPTAIFRGVRSEGESEWMCYSGIPSRAFDHRTGQEVTPWRGEVFLVFADWPDRCLYNWDWVRGSPENSMLPIDHQSRFIERLL